jgi:predicted NAD/FAD-binding protein
VLGKANGHAVRLASVLAVLGWSTGEEGMLALGEDLGPSIKEHHLVNAIRLLEDYFHPMAARVFGEAIASLEEKDARELAHWINAHCESNRIFTKRDVKRSLTKGRLHEDKHLDEAIKRLTSAGPVRELPRPSGGRQVHVQV